MLLRAALWVRGLNLGNVVRRCISASLQGSHPSEPEIRILLEPLAIPEAAMKVRAPFRTEVVRFNHGRERFFAWYFQTFKLRRYTGSEQVHTGSYSWNKFVAGLL